jgi:hypothetical protein
MRLNYIFFKLNRFDVLMLKINLKNIIFNTLSIKMHFEKLFSPHFQTY